MVHGVRIRKQCVTVSHRYQKIPEYNVGISEYLYTKRVIGICVLNKYIFLSICNAQCMDGFQYPDGSTITNLECVDGAWFHKKTNSPKPPDCARKLSGRGKRSVN